MPGWESLSLIYAKEYRQAMEEGLDVHTMPHPSTLGSVDSPRLLDLLDQFDRLPQRADYPYDEPDDFPSIISAYQSVIHASRTPTANQFLGAVLGRCVGCILGKPLEVGPYFWESTTSKPGWKYVKAWFEGAGQYPIKDYVPAISSASQRGLYVGYPDSQKGNIRFVETDDDLRYTVLSLELLEQKD